MVPVYKSFVSIYKKKKFREFKADPSFLFSQCLHIKLAIAVPAAWHFLLFWQSKTWSEMTLNSDCDREMRIKQPRRKWIGSFHRTKLPISIPSQNSFSGTIVCSCFLLFWNLKFLGLETQFYTPERKRGGELYLGFSAGHLWLPGFMTSWS